MQLMIECYVSVISYDKYDVSARWWSISELLVRDGNDRSNMMQQW